MAYYKSGKIPGIIILYRLFYAVVLGTAAYAFVRNVYAFQGKFYVHFTVMLFGLIFLLLLDAFVGRAAYYITCILAAAAAVYHVRYKTIDLTELTKEQKEAMLGPVNVRELWCVCLIVTAVLTAWILIEDLMILKAVSAAAAAGALVTAMIAGYDMPGMSVGMTLVYLVSNLLELLERHWEKQRSEGRKSYFVRIVPFLVLYFILIVVWPVRSTPYDWSITKNIFRRVQENFYKAVQNVPFGSGEDFDISSTGFSEGSHFFGDLVNDEKEVMHLKKNASFDKNVYLTGRVYDAFDGRTWKNTLETKRKDVWFDALETFYAAYRYDSEHRQDYIRKTELQVEYRFFHTKYFFAPLKTLGVEGPRESEDYTAEDGWYKFRRKKNFNTQYKVEYYVMNRMHPDFVKMVEAVSAAQKHMDSGGSSAGKGMDEAESADAEKMWGRVLKKHDLVSGVLRYEDLQDYRQRMQGYLIVPEVSDEVDGWLQALCQDAGSDYEKLVRLEEALRSFTYSARPGKLPSDIDTEQEYLDYFLLEKKEGYCSYFATSFVLLARKLGMPARLAEGYCVHGAGSGSKNGNALEHEVMSYMAHAWPEVYFEGVGWIPFEPTPGFYDYRGTMWKTSGDMLREKEEADAASENAADVRRRDSMYEDEDEDEDVYEEGVQPEDPFVYDFIMFILYVLSGAAVIFMLFIICDAVLEKVHTAKMFADEKCSRAFRRNMQILEAMGYRRLPGETLAEFNGRLPEEESFIPLYEAYFYGDGQADGSLVERMSGSGRMLLKKLKREKGMKYYLIRFLLYMRRAR